MLKDPDTRKQLVIGIVTSLAVGLLIQPALGWLWQALDSASSAAGVMISNLIYKNAARGFEERYAFATMSLLHASFLGLTIGSSVVLVVLQYHFRRTLTSTPPERKIQEERDSRRLRSAYWVTLATLPITLVAMISLMVVETGVFKLNSSFNQTLAALGPDLDEMQLKKYRARWALMTSRADYENIKSDLLRVADDHKVHLPDRLRE